MKKIILFIIITFVLMGLVTLFGKEWVNLARTFLRELFRTIFK